MENFRHGLRRKEMTKEELDKMYDKRLENLYQMAAKKEDAGTAFMILEKIRVMKLYLIRPAEDKSPTK